MGTRSALPAIQGVFAGSLAGPLVSKAALRVGDLSRRWGAAPASPRRKLIGDRGEGAQPTSPTHSLQYVLQRGAESPEKPGARDGVCVAKRSTERPPGVACTGRRLLFLRNRYRGRLQSYAHGAGVGTHRWAALGRAERRQSCPSGSSSVDCGSAAPRQGGACTAVSTRTCLPSYADNSHPPGATHSGAFRDVLLHSSGETGQLTGTTPCGHASCPIASSLQFRAN